MTFAVRYAPTDTQSVGEKYAFWTALEWVVKEVPEHEQLFVLMDANARTGRRGGGEMVSEKCKVLSAYDRDTLLTIMVSDSFNFWPIMGLYC